jgi:hypothetical protein
MTPSAPTPWVVEVEVEEEEEEEKRAWEEGR